MIRKKSRRSLRLLSYAITAWLSMPAAAWAAESQPGETSVSTADIHVEADAAKEEAKYESQQKTIITKEDIEKKQAKSVEEIIFSETGVSRTVDAMGRVGVSIRGAEPRHTLILVDGQPVMGDFAKYYGAADEVMRLGTENVERIEIIRGAAGHSAVPVVGLAKQFELIFVEGESEPVELPRRSDALYLVQRIRDEAHRFAITYHRSLRGKRNLVSVLDHIVGVGPKRRQALREHFGTIEKMKAASVDELVSVRGMNRPAAEAVYHFFEVQRNLRGK